MRFWQNLWQDNSGQGLAEYSLILSVVLVAAVVIVATMSDKIQLLFTQTSARIDEAINR